MTFEKHTSCWIDSLNDVIKEPTLLSVQTPLSRDRGLKSIEAPRGVRYSDERLSRSIDLSVNWAIFFLRLMYGTKKRPEVINSIPHIPIPTQSIVGILSLLFSRLVSFNSWIVALFLLCSRTSNEGEALYNWSVNLLNDDLNPTEIVLKTKLSGTRLFDKIEPFTETLIWRPISSLFTFFLLFNGFDDLNCNRSFESSCTLLLEFWYFTTSWDKILTDRTLILGFCLWTTKSDMYWNAISSKIILSCISKMCNSGIKGMKIISEKSTVAIMGVFDK